MKTLTLLIISIFLVSSGLTGCANFSANPKGLLGINTSDLVKAKSAGVEQSFDLSYNEAFDKVTSILIANKLNIYQSDRRKGLIVVMNFPKQTDTTRVGIFFDKETDERTTITLSSLSSTALEKAESIIFAQLDPGIEVIK